MNLAILFYQFIMFESSHIYLVVIIHMPYTRCYGSMERGKT